MGREIVDLAAMDKTLSVTGAAGRVKKLDFDPIQTDVVIEFSTPDGFGLALDWCVKHGKPLVSGTTGLSDRDKRKLSRAAKRIAVLYSANMSLGIAVLSSMLESFRALPDWDFQIEEAHHNQKKDRPSGTAILLDQRLESVLGRKLPEPNSLRGGGIPGIHQVWAMGPEEVVVLQHTAFNRKVFACGALRAARWLFDKGQPGLYDLSDLYKTEL
ncbi:MAG: 4-hydroxy-tetrahydrodipicolinate reductase [Calothrix sp. SM1_5_4]|nr:4-hydroxy-tetrahydrodipicolinate reductase [Calothrix sp. SM1_5_4]